MFISILKSILRIKNIYKVNGSVITNGTISFTKKIKKLVVDVEDKAQNLKELLEIVYLNLKVNLSNAEQALFTEEEIKGFILYQACKDW